MRVPHPKPLSPGERGHPLPRWLEIPLTLLGLAATFPVLLVAAAAIKLTSPGPILFRQERIGRGGEPFQLLKLRSMVQRVDQDTDSRVTAWGDVRITGVGRILRKTKIDELPGLWNVVRGEMALVGPRPEVPRYVDLADARWQTVLAARPGLTDPVTLSLRNEEELLARLSGNGDREMFYRERLVPFKLAGYQAYLKRRTPWRDAQVLFATVLGVLLPRRHPPPEV